MKYISVVDRYDGVRLINDLTMLSNQLEEERIAGAPELDCAIGQAFLHLKITALGQDGLYSKYDA
jgi:hypothetical protein